LLQGAPRSNPARHAVFSRVTNREMSTLTVLICTHNRNQLLQRTLQHLNAARRPRGCQVSILVVANACTDDSIEYLKGFAGTGKNNLPLRWIEEPLPGKSHALNRAIPLLESELVAFVDDDHRVDPEYLEAVCQAAAEYPDAALFCGRILPDWDGSEPAWVHDDGPYRIYPLPVPRFDQGDSPRLLSPDIAIPGGGNLFIRVEWLSLTGEFSTDLGPSGHDLGGSEDVDWILRAQTLGAKLQYVPSMIQYHYVDISRFNLPYMMKKAYKRSASTVEVLSTTNGQVPRYLYRKIGEYLLSVLTSFSVDRRRFYLVRTAAALGEIQGHRRSASNSASSSASTH
jgi:GT2 family glycosyltransferase